MARAGNRAVPVVGASHVVLASFRGWAWCVARPHVRAASGRPRYNVPGAPNAVTHARVTEIHTTYITATPARARLRTIAGLGGAVPVTSVLDNARDQRCAWVQDCAKALGIALLFRPSYSPNRNPLERRWKLVTEEAPNRRPHQDFNKFQDAIHGCWADLPTKRREKRATLRTHSFQTWDDVSLLNA